MTKEHRDTLFQTDNFPKTTNFLEKQLFQFKDKLAVRSSAIGEDGEIKVMLVNTLQCSIYRKSRPSNYHMLGFHVSDRVTHYSENHHKMAVVIQEYVVAKWSGVVYNQPTQWIFFRIIIESFPGVGEKVVFLQSFRTICSDA